MGTATPVAPARAVVVREIPHELVVGNRQPFKLDVLDEIAAGARRFVFDLSTTGYVDSAGLGMLFSLSKRIREAGGWLVLCGVNDDLKTLLELTGMDTHFAVAESRDLAFRALDALEA